MRFADHELKLLNASVIVYVLAGAFVFHSLDEFADQVPAEPRGRLASSPPSRVDGSVGRPDEDNNRSGVAVRRASRAFEATHLHELRLRAVRRMWNITNQLNILYESNWTALVLDELVQFERKLLESLELAGEPPDENGSESEGTQDDRESNNNDDADDDDEKKKTGELEDEKRSKRPDSRRNRAQVERLESQARLRSIKRSLVHSLATVTTMGSPVQPPRSQLGKLLTILYGALGIPLLVVSVAKSGNQLARSGLNGLLLVRHYCFSLPLHYLCCSCNLFLCLRWLSWCCCCCCCSYLCCLNDDKQKCCDDSRRPRLRLAPSGSRTSDGQRAGPPWGMCEKRLPPMGSTSFVIGFSVPAAQVADGGHIDQAQFDGQTDKSVRFSAGGARQTHRAHEATNRLLSDSLPDDQDEDDNQLVAYYSRGVFLTALSILALYVSAGAYYISLTQQLSLTDSLFACYAMLATSKLPDSFQLEPPAKDPFDHYKWIASVAAPDSRPPPSKGSNSSPNVRKSLEGKRPGDLFARGSVESLTLSALYLLIGLNLISACAHFARLWLGGMARRRLLSGECPAAKVSASKCNGQGALPPASSAAPSSLLGHSFSGHLPEQRINEAEPASRHSSSGGGATQSNHSTSLQPDQINLADLFALEGDPQLPLGQHSADGSFASDRSSGTASRPLCARHQSALAIQALNANVVPYAESGGNPHLELSSGLANHQLHHRRHQQTSADNSTSDSERMLQSSCGTLRNGQRFRTSSSSLQLGALNLPLVSGQLPTQATDPQADCALNSIPIGHQHFQPQTAVNGRNGFGCSHSQNEPDSSPNTLDTNSQTMSSSMSSRALAMKPPALKTNAGPEKAIWFSDQAY